MPSRKLDMESEMLDQAPGRTHISSPEGGDIRGVEVSHQVPRADLLVCCKLEDLRESSDSSSLNDS